MVSKSQIKLITSLTQKKNRSKLGLFLVEGKKGIKEILASPFELDSLYTTQPVFDSPEHKTFEITEAELKKISCLNTPQTALAVFKIPAEKKVSLNKLTLALDGVRDPGNLGTIIRLCDWFGINNLICSQDTVDCYNPKVVQASMGSITRVNILYLKLNDFFSELKNIPVMGAFVEGENIYRSKFPDNGIVILGNEANGISAEIEELVSKKISIPQFGTSAETESLNVATAAAIFLSEYSRQRSTEK